ncbi:MAG TPA: CPBP family glutamic-type intramembrane protease, partial [bacterium]|nr:CPBP family glutamic-type intramembrane protease [bacterium]
EDWLALLGWTAITIAYLSWVIQDPSEMDPEKARQFFGWHGVGHSVEHFLVTLTLVAGVQLATDGSLRPLGLPGNLTWRGLLGGVAVGVAYFLGLSVLLPSILSQISSWLTQAHPNVLQNSIPDLPTFLRAVTIVFFSGALREELWRTTTIRAWERVAGPKGAWFGYGFSAVAFALGHGYQGRVAIAITGLLGLLMGLRWLRNRDLVELIVIHLAFDLCVLIVLFATGTAPR